MKKGQKRNRFTLAEDKMIDAAQRGTLRDVAQALGREYSTVVSRRSDIRKHAAGYLAKPEADVRLPAAAPFARPSFFTRENLATLATGRR